MPKLFMLAAGLVVVPLAMARADDAALRALTVTPDQIERMEIRIEAVKPTSEQVAALLPGTVVPAQNARIVAPAPFGGTISQVHILPGQQVAKGAKLATISSRELLEAASSLAQAEAELQVADATARRKRMLADKNIQSPTLAEEAEGQVLKVKAVIDQHKRTLSIGGITSLGAGSYSIHAPASGRVVETRVVPGDKIDAMAPAVTIDTSDELWIEGQLPSQLVARVAIGDRIKVANGPEGKIVAIGGSLDKMTRSAKLIASVPANSGLLPGQMVTLTVVQQAATGALSVPSSAVARIKETEGVFVRNDSGFTLVPVTVAGRSPEAATVVGNIAGDARVAASGLPQLEQMLEAD